MKAFKLASAFAVTGLALAISGQAMAAETTTEWTWEGEVVFSADLMNNNTASEKMYMKQGTVGERGANGDTDADISVEVAVANGGFSGTIALGAGSTKTFNRYMTQTEFDAYILAKGIPETYANYVSGNSAVVPMKTQTVGGSPEITISDLMYEEGALSFGDIGSMNSTEGYIDGMSVDQAYSVDRALRYTMDNGFAVQAFGGVSYESDDSSYATLAFVDMGVAVAYTGEFEGGSFAVDVEYAETTEPTYGTDLDGVGYVNGVTADAAADKSLPIYTGVGVTFDVSDAVAVSAAYTKGLGLVGTDLEEKGSMGVRADYTADAITAYAQWIDANGTQASFGAEYAFDMGSVYLDYALDTTPVAGTFADVKLDGAKNVGVKLAGAADAMTWAANYDYAIDTKTYSLGASVGVDTDMAAYAVSYKLREVGAKHTETGVAAADKKATSEIKASATHTTEGGATLALAYEMDNGAFASKSYPYKYNSEDTASNNALTFTAAYSF